METKLPSNSHRSKEERKKLEKVVNGPVRVKKKNELSKIKDAFISEDIANIKEYVFMDILIPAIQKLVVDIFTDGIRMVFYGGKGGVYKRSNADRFQYTQYSSKDSYGGDRFGGRTQTRSGYSYDDITVDTRGEAEDVLSRMDELIETYGFVTVADLYDLVGVTGNYTDNKYGWTNLRTAEIVRRADGYKIKLPRALPIN